MLGAMAKDAAVSFVFRSSREMHHLSGKHGLGQEEGAVMPLDMASMFLWQILNSRRPVHAFRLQNSN